MDTMTTSRSAELIVCAVLTPFTATAFASTLWFLFDPLIAWAIALMFLYMLAILAYLDAYGECDDVKQLQNLEAGRDLVAIPTSQDIGPVTVLIVLQSQD